MSSHNLLTAGTSPEVQVPNNSVRKKKVWYTVTIVLVVALLSTVVGAYIYFRNNVSNKEPPKLKVGVMMAFSGGSSSMGYGAMKGILLAKRELGANNIEIIQMDSRCDAKAAASAIKRLIEQHVAAIIGEGCSSASAAVLVTANNNKIVMISPSAASPTLSIPDDYFFRMIPPNTFQGSFIAKAIYDRGIRNVAMFYTNQSYVRGLNNAFQERLEALGGKVVATATAEPEAIGLHSQIQTLKSANPQAILIAPSSVVSATAIIKLLHEAGVTVPLFGTDIMYDTTIIENGGAAAEGLVISSFSTGNNSFQQTLVNEYQKTEQLYGAPQAYDIIKLLQLAVEKGATTGEKIKNILPQIEFDGKSGHIVFDQNGEISGKNYRYDLFKIKNGSFVYVEHE